MSASDIPWPSLVIDASEVRIDNQGYGLHRQNPDRAIRRQVFESFFGTWKQYESAIGQTLAAQVQARVFEARMRNFSSAREAALFVDNLPVAIYDRLIEQAHAGLPVLHRYFRLRARMLGVDDLAYHDIYPELVSVPGLSYTLDEAKTLTRQALAPFGPEYLAVLDSGFEGDWMHAFPQEGKRSGAYVFGSAYDVHPYVLLNHQDDFDSLSTFAHEWGHAVHSVLSNQSQPWETAGYATFVAEMASTINSILLLQKLQAEAGSDRQRLYFLAQELETYRATFFRQAMFAEFDASIHAAAEAGEALTGERFTAMYLELLRRYHGSDEGVMSIDPRYALEWAYIPHFYRNFYVFQYATSVTASTAFASRLVGPEGVQARKDVIGMLRKGSSEYPHAMFVAAGVDLSEPGPYQTVFARMNAIMDEMERLDGAARS
ncbi:MAG: oligoendopeptidase F family protein [Pseudomonadales bacterium]|nr:oligoendopeptidase F family protein [Pseudomonadales bacterium]